MGWIGSALEYYDFFIHATAASRVFPQILFHSAIRRSRSSRRSPMDVARIALSIFVVMKKEMRSFEFIA